MDYLKRMPLAIPLPFKIPRQQLFQDIFALKLPNDRAHRQALSIPAIWLLCGRRFASQ
jgi:hypothetical protein